MTRFLAMAALVYRVPLALASFVLFRVFRWLMRRAVNAFYTRRPEQALRWRPLSAQTLRNPLALPVLMTSAPRWNPHAVIATAGPLPVKNSLTIDVAEARRSAASWSIVVYTFPGFQTVATLDARAVPEDAASQTIALRPGRYWLGLRYYRWSNDAALPAVLLDEAPVVSAQPLAADVNAFYADLSRRRGWFYFCLHYYVWLLLRYDRCLPTRFVECEYLPVGNPGTRFLYGIVAKGQRLQLEVTPEILRTHDVFLTIYSRASLPLTWCRVSGRDYLTEPCVRTGHYLIRVHPRGSSGEVELDRATVQVRIV